MALEGGWGVSRREWGLRVSGHLLARLRSPFDAAVAYAHVNMQLVYVLGGLHSLNVYSACNGHLYPGVRSVHYIRRTALDAAFRWAGSGLFFLVL